MHYFIDAITKHYFDFKGRARRAEYWYFVLFNFIFAFVVALISLGLLGTNFLSNIYALAVFLPSLAVVVRRLHDVGKSGWWYFILLIPIIGLIWFIVLMVRDGESWENAWGENPKAPELKAQAEEREVAKKFGLD